MVMVDEGGAVMFWAGLLTFIIVALLGYGITTLQSHHDQCVQNPLVFGAKQIEESYGYKFQGIGTLLVDDPSLKSPSFSFNSTNLTIRD